MQKPRSFGIIDSISAISQTVYISRISPLVSNANFWPLTINYLLFYIGGFSYLV